MRKTQNSPAKISKIKNAASRRPSKSGRFCSVALKQNKAVSKPKIPIVSKVISLRISIFSLVSDRLKHCEVTAV
jgi:hypothetical protein